MSELPRSLRYLYLQNKSIHYDKLETIKATINVNKSPRIFKRSLDADGFSMNNKERNKVKRKIEGEN